MNDQNPGLRAPGSGLRSTLDQEIDRVAARLVSVDHDAAMVERIVSRLPERANRTGWFGVLLPQAAVATVLVVAAVLWTTREQDVVRDPIVAPPVAEVAAPVTEVPAVETSPVSVSPVRLAARLVTPAAVALPPDHERSLAPVEAPKPLEVVSLASPSLPEEAFVVLAPIVLTELSLSGEPNSPQK